MVSRLFLLRVIRSVNQCHSLLHLSSMGHCNLTFSQSHQQVFGQILASDWLFGTRTYSLVTSAIQLEMRNAIGKKARSATACLAKGQLSLLPPGYLSSLWTSTKSPILSDYDSTGICTVQLCIVSMYAYMHISPCMAPMSYETTPNDNTSYETTPNDTQVL